MAELVCDLSEALRPVCKGLGVDYEQNGKHYCVLHAPTKDKNLAAFAEAIEKKLKGQDFDFHGIYFPANVTFEGESEYSEATFEEWADFSYATFKEEVDFSYATFEGRTFFSNATFKGANFSNATFEGESEYSNATFEGKTYLDNAIFKEVGKFRSLRTSSQTVLSFRSAVIEKPERLSFHSTHLRPSWFIDVDAQKFDFSDVEWFRLPAGDELKLEKEIEALEAFEGGEALEGGNGEVPTPSLLRKLQKACRNLMNNAEENRDYATANEFHYWSMVLARKEAMVLARKRRFREGLRRFSLIDALYGALSGYGERPRRAFLVLVGMGTLFAILYVMVAGSIEHVGQAFLYSLAAMVRLTGVPAMASLTKQLQPSEPGLSGLFQLLVTAEGILGPLQIALLALAVRRRVMR